jgi:hypothetical protein
MEIHTSFQNDLRAFVLSSPAFVMLPSMMPKHIAYLRLRATIALRHFYAGTWVSADGPRLDLFLSAMDRVLYQLIDDGLLHWDSKISVDGDGLITLRLKNVCLAADVAIGFRMMTPAQIEELYQNVITVHA